ncbi:SDR family NAD(P)-dependent oxidoreductase [Alkalimonas collagenimarina]|uniref:SDR family NAD(P)-dependent oxidoreductase n=1 Tax=Alkalimonas collagenimarina TaxID=400390 RepID=A0ABT9H1L7_9GAMM|nr:SDR family NAD(P)-dependent oxidoreductase [Alkalimonas collagenimarina]MDP4536964.1 SDR family NAD(P)-dependent oxidoreductase [Alkalimonas collagenimarina]
MSNQKIAIIGISGKYPGADNLDELWENLKQGKDTVTEIPKTRWDHALYYQPGNRVYGKSYSKWGGFINDVDQFDSLFFNMAPKVAELIDPQERQFLQCAYHTVEDAGYSCEGLSERGPVGVFCAVEYNEYLMYSQANTPVSALNASITNRVSYCCNFTGPSMTIDTMCSGSISSVHLACQSIINGDCRAAIAGGVNLTLHPNKFILHSAGRFSSQTGRCHSFGDKATGYVASEGVGAVLLKPLDDALEDGDHIYGVILATAINHGGASRAYTVPKASSQAEVISQALAKTASDPISYIEAHGSGTAIGDVIEVDGLQRAYNDSYLAKNAQGEAACLIGSIKSNIGHCESASGIAGLTKVLLQMRHKTIAPSIHSQTRNPYIDFDNSPFDVPHEAQHWQVAEGKKRVAGISAFGAGGSNAHMVIEEYVAAAPVEHQSVSVPCYIVLSAQSLEQLHRAVKQLHTTLEHTGQSIHDVQDLRRIACTLQVGRSHHEHRLALAVNSVDELKQQLAYTLAHQLDDINKPTHCWYGEMIKGKALDAFITANNLVYADLLSKADWPALIGLWIQGYPVDWRALYGGALPNKVSLPGYPFAKQRYWAPDTDVERTYPPLAQLEALAANTTPLRERAASYLKPLQSIIHLTGSEYFIAQHGVNQHPILPGVAYLELIREALSTLLAEHQHYSIDNVTWRRPMIFDGQSKQVVIELSCLPQAGQRTRFRIYDLRDQSSGDFCRGAVNLCEREAPSQVPELAQLRATGKVIEVDKQTFYRQFLQAGLDYGPVFRAVESLQRSGSYVVGRLQAQQPQPQLSHAMKWRPEILDSALHCILGFYLGEQSCVDEADADAQQGPMVPFALSQVREYAPLPESVWVLLDAKQCTASTQNIDLSLCDEQGNVCLQLLGYTARVMKQSTASTKEQAEARGPKKTERAEPVGEIKLLSPTWQPQPLTDATTSDDFNGDATWIVLLGEAAQWSAQLDARFSDAEVLCIDAPAEKPGTPLCRADHYQHYAQALLAVLQQVIQHQEAKPERIQLVTSSGTEQRMYMGLLPMLEAAIHEHVIKFADVIMADSGAEVEKQIRRNGQIHTPSCVELKSQQGDIRRWQALPAAEKTVSPWQEQGVYLITGGFGGLGKIFTQTILAQTRVSTVILWGRGELDLVRQEWLTQCNAQGVRVHYQAIDITQLNVVEDAITQVLEEFGHITGILHAAGELQDGMIVRKSAEQMDRVLSPKVQGLVNLDAATRICDLKFFALFSSISSVLGAPGQADYAAANGFMDWFAHDRAQRVKRGECAGHSVSVNWPLWQDGGMRMPRHAMRELKETSGLIPLPTEAGLDAFSSALAAKVSQVLVLYGKGEAYQNLAHTLQAVDEHHTTEQPELRREPVSFNMQDVIRAASDLLKVPQSSIDGTTALFDIGFDSVSISELAHVLTQATGVELPVSVFYDCTQIDELTHYLQAQMSQDEETTTAQETTAVHQPPGTAEIAPSLSEETVIAMISELLKVPASSIDANTAFSDIGFDSVSLGELASHLSQELDIEISATLFYECTVVAELVAYVQTQLTHASTQPPAQLTNTAPSTPCNERDVITEISELLKVPVASIDADTTFEQIGFDSVSLTELASVLSARYEVELSTMVFYQCTSVGELTQHMNVLLSDAQSQGRRSVPVHSSAYTVKSRNEMRSDIAQTLLMLISEMLKIAQHDFDVHTPLEQLGFDSVSFAELAQALNHRYQAELAPTIFYDINTVSALAAHLADLQRDDKAPLEYVEQVKAGHSQPPVEPSARPSADDMPGAEQHAHQAKVNPDDDSIAIIGMDGQFPGANDIAQFWDNMAQGKDCVTEIPRDRWDWREVYGDTKQDPRVTRSKWGGFLAQVDQFDAGFFGISSHEARQMDPQQRLLLQSAWHAIENAGYAPESLSGSNTGVYIGIAHTSGYGSVDSVSDQDEDTSTELSGPINAPSLGPNRISYFLNLKGPSEPVETACSSALVALHRAVTALRSGDCRLCLVGGVNVIVTAQGHINLSRAGLLSEVGQCRAFAANADGYVRSEGVATVLLKRLSEAKRDGDNILAVIRNSKVGYTGKGSGFAAPNSNSQAALIKACYEEKNIDIARVSCIEAQGTGTEIGDAVEFQALTKAFKGAQQGRCALASVKTHVGHMEMASGMASLLKVVLQMQHNHLVANLHCDELNPHINITQSPFYIPSTAKPWTSGALRDPKVAGVNAFGFGGVNAHVIVEQYLAHDTHSTQQTHGPYAMLLSAKTRPQIETQARNLLAWLDREPQLDLYRVAYTLQVGRSAMEERLAMVVNSKAEFVERLTQVAQGEYNTPGVYQGTRASSSSIVSLLQSDTALQAVVDGWLKSRELSMLASLWCNGLSIAWQNMYQGEGVRRVNLPGYPFKTTRHWIGEFEQQVNQSADHAEQVTADTELAEHLLRLAQDSMAGHQNLTLTGALDLSGCSSVELVQWQQKIHQTLNVQVATEDLMATNSIRALAAQLRALQADASPQAKRAMVSLSGAKGVGPALICVPAAGAMLSSFSSLAKLLQGSMRLYGFGHRGFHDQQTPHDSIQTMAQDYVAQLSSLPEQQTIYLLGHSLGASVVYEMACLLRNVGRKVHIFMLDSELYAQGGISLSTFFQFFVRDKQVANTLAHKQAHGDDVVAPLAQALLDETAVSTVHSKAYLQQIMHAYAQQILMGLQYVPSQKYDGDITLLLAKQSHMGGENRQQTLAKYRRYCLQNISLVSVSGGHYSVLEKAHVADVAQILRQTITPQSIVPAGEVNDA